MSDKRLTLIKDILYGQETTTIGLNEEQSEQQEVIERTWNVLKQRETNQLLSKLDLQYQHMREAAAALKSINLDLYKAALPLEYNKGDPVETFPVQLRVPTDTPPTRNK